MLKIVETLYERGYEIKIFDQNVSKASAEGANRDYIRNGIPHVYRMLTVDARELLDHAQTVVVGNKSQIFQEILRHLRPGQSVVDIAKLLPKSEVVERKARQQQHGARKVAAAAA